MSMKKTTLATLVGAAALTVAGAANATIVVGGSDGYEFSVDGNINQFYTYADTDNSDGSSTKNSEVANGLLPTFFGFNVKSPEINGLTMGARVSISPSTNNFTTENGANGAASMEQREAFATIDGSFGQILAGKALGLYSANNILLDQTLFGVGATSGASGTTTLGRIGYGYDYANWRSQIRYTTPNMNGFSAAIAIMDADTNGLETETDPRYEVSLSYATAFDGGSAKVWADYMDQSYDVEDVSIDSDAWTVGGQLVVSGFEVVAAYYDNEGVGDLGGLGRLSQTDINGEERDGDGYYVQAGYNFAGTTWLKASYGESTLDQTTAEQNGDILAALSYDVKQRDMVTVGLYHDVNANLKLVAEYSQMETDFHSGANSEETDVFSLGGFVTW